VKKETLGFGCLVVGAILFILQAVLRVYFFFKPMALPAEASGNTSQGEKQTEEEEEEEEEEE